MKLKGHDMFVEYLEKLRSVGRRYFTSQQVIEELQISQSSAKSGLYRLKKSGKLISPIKGLYVIIPPERRPYGSIPAEELVPIIMKHIKANYYVSLLSAAGFYGAAHQKSSKFQVISNKRIKHSLNFGQVKLEMIYKKSLAKSPIQNFIVNTGYLKVATPELVAIDLLNYPYHSGGLNHISTVLCELIESIDEDKLIRFAQQISEKYQLQRLGYILEKIETMEEDKKNRIIAKLEAYLTEKKKIYIPLTTEMPKTGYPRCKKWKIIENIKIESDL